MTANNCWCILLFLRFVLIVCYNPAKFPAVLNIYNKIKILLTYRVNCHFINEIYYF